MANRLFQQFRFSLEKQPVDLWGKFAVGASGAPTISVANSKGITSIVRNSTGKYTITLQDTYVKLLSFHAVVLGASGLPAAPQYNLVSQAVTTAGAPTVVVQFATGTTATDLDSGTTVYFSVTLSNSTAV